MVSKVATLPSELLRGPQGPVGPVGIGLVGPEGKPGRDGERGSQGPSGEKGDKGDPGTTPIPKWEGTRLNWIIEEEEIKGPDLRGPSGAGGGGGAQPQTSQLYFTSSFTSSASIGSEGNRIALVDASSGEVTITLPKASSFKSFVLHVKKIDSSPNAVIIQPKIGETIDGQDCFAIYVRYENFMIVSDGDAWYVL